MKKRILLGAGAFAIVALTAGAAFLVAESNPAHQIGPNTAVPAYIAVNTPTFVTFTSVMADSSLWKHDPLKVLLVRTDSSGQPIDIVARMLDNGRRPDAKRHDHTYGAQVVLNEASAGPIQFRVAARFKTPLSRNDDSGDDDWDRDIANVNDTESKNIRANRLPPLLQKLRHYSLSDPIVVTVRVPTITWSPSNLELTLSPPETATRQLTLTSDTTISNVTIEADRKLARFLSIGPFQFSALRANQQQAINVAISTSSAMPLGTFDGTVQVRYGSQTTPQVLKVTLNLWPTFSDPDLKISLKTPPDWTGTSLPTMSYFVNSKDAEVLEARRFSSADTILNFVERSISDNACESEVNGQASDHLISANSTQAIFVLYCTASSEQYHFVTLAADGSFVELIYHDDFDWNAVENDKLAVFRQLIDSLTVR